MAIILFIIGICVLFIYRNDWKKCLYLLLFMVPYFGYIQLHISNFTALAPLIHDITVILPLYLLFILNKMRTKNVQFSLPGYFNNFLLFFVFVIIIFTISPFYEIPILARLVGAKVWLFYLLFIFIGFEFIENELELKKFCNFFAIVAIIPCVIGILQYLGSFYIDHRETMTFFYGGNARLASITTQGFGQFDWGAGIKIIRLPSTFSYATQFSTFTLCAFIPALASVGFSKTPKEKYFYLMIIVLIIIGSFSSGIRATSLYFLLFFIFLMVLQTRFYNVIILSVAMVIILSLVNWESFPILRNIVMGVVEPSMHSIETYIFVGQAKYGELFSNYFWGAGVGSATPEARFVLPGGKEDVQLIHEGYYQKAIKELGIIGLPLVAAFLIIIVYEIFFSIKFLTNKKVYLFCSGVLAFYLISMIFVLKGASLFTKYPSNFLLYFFLGIVIKTRFLNLDDKKQYNKY